MVGREQRTLDRRSIRTRALASTWAPLRSNIRMISVWLARAAKCSGVSPRTVGRSGLASCCSKNITMFMQPMKLATCKGVRPDCGQTETIAYYRLAEICKRTHTFTNRQQPGCQTRYKKYCRYRYNVCSLSRENSKKKKKTKTSFTRRNTEHWPRWSPPSWRCTWGVIQPLWCGSFCTRCATAWNRSEPWRRGPRVSPTGV